RGQSARAELTSFDQVRVPKDGRVVESGDGVSGAGAGESGGGEERLEVTKATEKIHNEGTKITEGNEKDLGGFRLRGTFVSRRLLRCFVVNLLRSLRHRQPATYGNLFATASTSSNRSS